MYTVTIDLRVYNLNVSQNNFLLIKKAVYRSNNRGCKETCYLFKNYINQLLFIIQEDAQHVKLLPLYLEILEEKDHDVLQWLGNYNLFPNKYLDLLHIIFIRTVDNTHHGINLESKI